MTNRCSFVAFFKSEHIKIVISQFFYFQAHFHGHLDCYWSMSVGYYQPILELAMRDCLSHILLRLLQHILFCSMLCVSDFSKVCLCLYMYVCLGLEMGTLKCDGLVEVRWSTPKRDGAFAEVRWSF